MDEQNPITDEVNGHGPTCRCGRQFKTVEGLEKHIEEHRVPDPSGDGRPPTDDEMRGILRCLVDDHDREQKRAYELLDAAHVVVTDSYVSGCPGYAGKVAVVMYDGGPHQIEVFVWRNEDPERVHARGGGD